MTIHAKSLAYFRLHYRGFIISLLAVICLIYLPFLGSPLFFDDLRFFSGTVTHYTTASFFFDPRWFADTTLAWTWRHFSDIPPIHRLFNLLLHAACVLLLFFWLRKLTALATLNTESSQTTTNYINWGAWLGALFFACNPIAVYAVGYVVQRSILLATFFTLAMQMAYLRGLLCEQRLGQKLWLTLSVALYFFAVFSKEHSLMAPAVIMATTLLLRPAILPHNRLLWATWFAYLIIGALIVLRVKGVIGTVYEFDGAQLFSQLEMSKTSTDTLHTLSSLTQAGLFFKYLLLWILPNPEWLSIDMREPFMHSLTAWKNWLPLVGFTVYGLLSLRLLLLRGWYGLAGLGMLYPWLFFMAEFSTVRIQEPFVLYRSYLWLPGMMLFFPILIHAIPDRKKTVITLITVIILCLVPLSWNRLWVFADNYRLWNDAALLLPHQHTSGAARIYYNRGVAELESKKWKGAATDFQRVIDINPNIAQAHNNLGTAYSGLEQYQEAIGEFDQAIKLNPGYADAYYGKGLTLMRLHLNKDALANIKKSCVLKNSTACLITALSNARK